MTRPRPGAYHHSRTFGRLDRWDPLSFIFLAHALLMAAFGQTRNDSWIVLLAGVNAVVRLGIGWLTPREFQPRMRLLRSVLSLALAYGVVVADGGVESPFFFWILLLLGWKALVLDQRMYRVIAVLTLIGYVAVLILTADGSAAALLRLGLLAAFTVVLALGRRILEARESEVARLDDMVRVLIDEAPMAISVLDADRDRVLYANAAAIDMGIASRDDMARLLLTEGSDQRRVITLAELVVGSGFVHSPPRPFRDIASPNPQYRIGFHPRRGDGAPSVLIYGTRIEDDESQPV